jgi:tetratricopeptide (TPR) repeat protein
MSEHELWNEVGNLYFLSGEYPQAVHAYNRSIRLDEGFGRPYSNLALTYVQQGRFDEAVDLYRRSIELLAENKEKAISWNRLGNVYRCLKNYQQAVLAYRHADELDPENAESRDEPGWVSDPDTEAPARKNMQGAHPDPIEQGLTFAKTPPVSADDPALVSSPADTSTATWSLADSTPYQGDVSHPLETGSLTTWGEPIQADDDSEVDWAADPDPEISMPDGDSDDLTKWLPLPEEAPQDVLDLAMEEDAEAQADQADDTDIEPEPFELSAVEPEALTTEAEVPQNSVDGSSGNSSPDPEHAKLAPEEAIGALLPARTSPGTASEYKEPMVRRAMELDIIVQELPAEEFMVAADSKQRSTTAEAVPDESGSSSIVRSQAEPASPGMAEMAAPERDPEEMREIERGIAKFKRVVQINPRNAHAWDALGNLYKSAGLYKEALLAYQQAIANDLSKALYHHHLGLVYACEGRMEDAIDAFQKVVEIDPDHGLAHATLGGYYRKMGLEELAQKHVGKAMKSIFDSENEYNRACLAAICGNTDQALDLLRVALKNKQTYVDWILRDPDLDFIRQDPRFKQLISDYAR